MSDYVSLSFTGPQAEVSLCGDWPMQRTPYLPVEGCYNEQIRPDGPRPTERRCKWCPRPAREGRRVCHVHGRGKGPR